MSKSCSRVRVDRGLLAFTSYFFFNENKNFDDTPTYVCRRPQLKKIIRGKLIGN